MIICPPPSLMPLIPCVSVHFVLRSLQAAIKWYERWLIPFWPLDWVRRKGIEFAIEYVHEEDKQVLYMKALIERPCTYPDSSCLSPTLCLDKLHRYWACQQVLQHDVYIH